MDFEWTALSLQRVLAGNTATAVFVLGTLFVFLVLAAQYESWSPPLVIILIVPLRRREGSSPRMTAADRPARGTMSESSPQARGDS